MLLEVKSGAAIFLGSSQFLVALLLTEALYPGYDISTNAISDLGATCASLEATGASGCTVFQPSSNIFNSSLVILGVLLLLGAYFLLKAGIWKPLASCVILSGIGAMGVGFLPETAGYIHLLFSLVAFLFSGVAGILSFRVLSSPLKQAAAALGVLSLASLILFAAGLNLGLGHGGMEIMVVYPALIWFLAFGAHLISSR